MTVPDVLLLTVPEPLLVTLPDELLVTVPEEPLVTVPAEPLETVPEEVPLFVVPETFPDEAVLVPELLVTLPEALLVNPVEDLVTLVRLPWPDLTVVPEEAPPAERVICPDAERVSPVLLTLEVAPPLAEVIPVPFLCP